VHSDRTVLTQRPATALARGLRMGLFRNLMPSAAKTASKEAVNLASRSRMRNLTAFVSRACGGEPSRHGRSRRPSIPLPVRRGTPPRSAPTYAAMGRHRGASGSLRRTRRP
jgi:hypothetical protein